MACIIETSQDTVYGYKLPEENELVPLLPTGAAYPLTAHDEYIFAADAAYVHQFGAAGFSGVAYLPTGELFVLYTQTWHDGPLSVHLAEATGLWLILQHIYSHFAFYGDGAKAITLYSDRQPLINALNRIPTQGHNAILMAKLMLWTEKLLVERKIRVVFEWKPRTFPLLIAADSFAKSARDQAMRVGTTMSRPNRRTLGDANNRFLNVRRSP